MNQFLKDVKEVYNFVAEREGEVSHIILQDDNFAVDLYDNWKDFKKEYSSADFEKCDYDARYEDGGVAIQLFFQFF